MSLNFTTKLYQEFVKSRTQLVINLTQVAFKCAKYECWCELEKDISKLLLINKVVFASANGLFIDLPGPITRASIFSFAALEGYVFLKFASTFALC